MKLKMMGQLAGAVALTVGLAGCMDVTMDMDIQSETNGKATTTMVMAPEFYAMAKAGMGAAAQSGQSTDGSATTTTPAASDSFCDEADATLTENADGSATCVMVKEGAFAEITDTSSDGGAKFEVVSPGVVKVSFSTADMKGEVAGDETAQDEQTKAMMQAFFEGHNITLRVHGKEVTDTNMTKSADGTSAEIVIPFLDLLNGTAQLPETLYATVKTN
jgi:hypothetical protein